jgi:aryl-alcohol dehydrogenase-like predicted oxidoreductase
LARLRRERREPIFIATKAGRRLDPHLAGGYNRANLTAFVERSLKNLAAESLDLLQLHCPPTDVYYRPEVFGILDDLTAAGKLRHYGVSVERVDIPLASVPRRRQIIFNMFRHRPSELLFGAAGATGRHPGACRCFRCSPASSDRQHVPDDHRSFNRRGESFDRGETFSGVDYPAALQAVGELQAACPADMRMAQFALRWILMFDAVTCAIPGAKRPAQVEENASAADLAPLSAETMAHVRAVYDRRLRDLVHHTW